MKFTPEEFGFLENSSAEEKYYATNAARIANEKLKSWIKEGKILYSMERNNTLWCKSEKPYPYRYCGTLVDIHELDPWFLNDC